MGDWPVSWRILAASLGLYPVDASSTPPPSCAKQKCVQTVPAVPWEAKSLPGENHFALIIYLLQLGSWLASF